MFQTIKNFALSVTSNLAPALSKLFKAVKEGLADFKNSDTFKSIMDSMRKFFDSASGKASGAIKSFFDNLPNLVKRMVLFSSKLEIIFLEIQKAITYLPGTDKSNRKNLELEIKAKEKDYIRSKTQLDFDDVQKEIEKTDKLTYNNILRISQNSELQRMVAKAYNQGLVDLSNQVIKMADTSIYVQVNNTQNAEAQIMSRASAQIVKTTQIGAR